MKSFSRAFLPLLFGLLLSCTGRVDVTFTADGVGPDTAVVFKRLDVNTFTVLDTVYAGSDGIVKWSGRIESDEPEFIYIFKGDDRLAALLLTKGDDAEVSADSLGNYTVSGSAGSELLAQAEADYAGFLSQAVGRDGEEIARAFVDYYGKCVTLIVGNPYSLVQIPVLYRKIGDFPVFGRSEDVLFFRRACDSLKTVYPDSRLVAALENETLARERRASLQSRIESAEEVGFPDISLPNLDGESVALGSVDAKVIVVAFWGAGDNAFNIDVLGPVYEKYHDKGLEIYSVSTNPDKIEWASDVKYQNLAWINLNDGRGENSPALSIYNVKATPSCCIIAGGELAATDIRTAGDLENAIRKVSSCLQ